ncbi:MAG: exodeoxyribonuclease VII small subunit [bacterium]
MENKTLKKMLAELEQIVGWFETQKEPDIEAGLEKVREGVSLIKQSRKRLQHLENEFEEIKKDIDTEEREEPPTE